MATNARAGFGTLLQYGDNAATESFTTIAEVTSLGPPEVSATFADATSMDSIGAWEEAIPVGKSAAEVPFDFNYIPAGTSHKAVITELGNTARTWRVCYPDFGTTNTTATVNTTTELLAATAHGFYTGQPCRFATSGAIPTSTPQVDTHTTYFLRVVSVDLALLHPTNADALANTAAINFSAAGTGNQHVLTGTLTTFDGIVSGFKSTPELKGKIGGSGKLKPSGEITNTP